MNKKISLFLFSVLLSLTLASSGYTMEKVAWFKSGSHSRFWPVVEKIMKAAARDLDIDLQIYEFKNDPIYFVSLVKEVLSDPETRPACILTHNYKKRGQKVFELAEKFNVPIFLFNAGFPKDSDVGVPRGKYTQWIGQMLPDDEYAGYILTKELIERAKQLDANKTGTIQIVALEGNRTSEASVKRVAGLKRALSEHPEVTLNQYFHSKWKIELAKEAFRTSRHRYPETTVFWAASENMAIGVIDAAKQQNLQAGTDYITGGFDLLPENKNYLESGEMAVSVGGHYFEGAWALVLIHDFIHGSDFKAFGTTAFTTKMTPQTKEDFAQLQDIFSALTSKSLEDYDFKQLSVHHNPDLKNYDFSLESFLQNSRK